MKYLIVLFLSLTGCSICQVKNPLDGKGRSWCERTKRAEAFCDHDKGEPNIGVGYVTCGDNWAVTTRENLEALESQCKVRSKWGECKNISEKSK